MADLKVTVGRLGWEFWVGIAVAALAVIAIALVPSQVLEPKFGTRSTAFSPKTFPIMALSVMAIGGTLLALRSALSGNASRHDMPAGSLRPAVLPPMLIMLAYAALLDYLGTLITTALAVASLAYVLGSRWPTILSLAVSVPAFIWIVFRVALKVFLPEGILEGLV